jgi:RNA polymerase sigma-70 factor, ECF subfamily
MSVKSEFPAESILRALDYETDERLLIQAAQRDPACFAELYEHNFERVYAYIARRVPNREDAQDITAEVFHHALENLAPFQWRGVPFVAWLLRIASNTLADRWSKSARDPVSGAEFYEPEVDPETEQRTMLSELVDLLPPDQKLVIVRRFVEQRSIREIAEELKRSEGAIKQLQFRALQALRALIRE